MNIQHCFTYKECRLTDGSVIWEIWQNGSAQRIASAATEEEAIHLEMELNLAITAWAERTAQNSVDC